MPGGPQSLDPMHTKVRVARAAPHANTSPLRNALVFSGIVVLGLLLWLLRNVALLVFGAIVLAVAFNALAAPFERVLRLPRALSLTAVVVLLFAAVAAVVVFFGATLTTQVSMLISQLERSSSALAQAFDGTLIRKLLADGSATNLGSLASGLMSWGSSLIEFLTGLVLVFAGGVYLAGNPKLYARGFLKLIPQDHRPRFARALGEAGEALHRWLRGQLLAMLIVGAMTGGGLLLIGVPSAISLGVLAGLAEFVPIIGPILAAVPIMLIAGSMGWEPALYALALIFVVQQVESNFITPVVVGHAVAIAPAVSLFGIIAVGVVFGFPGLLFGFPLAIVIDVMVRRLYVNDVLKENVEVLADED